jgi:hypothetical protein
MEKGYLPLEHHYRLLKDHAPQMRSAVISIGRICSADLRRDQGMKEVAFLTILREE